MGLFGTVLAFGAGYATGMKLGDKPMEKLRETTPQMRDRTGDASLVDVRPVTEVMSTTVETVPSDTNLVEATQRMGSCGYRRRAGRRLQRRALGHGHRPGYCDPRCRGGSGSAKHPGR